MDDRMMSQLLETYGVSKGAPVSARNANAIRQFGAANPDVLERRAMGMRGSGVDDNSDLLDAMLDKVMQQTAATPPLQAVQAPVPQGTATARPPQRVAGPQARPTGTPSWSSMNENPNLGPLPARNASPGERDAGIPPNVLNDGQGNVIDPITGIPSNGDKGILGLIMTALFGASSAAGREGMRPRNANPTDAARLQGPQGNAQVTGPDPNAKQLTYQPKLEDKSKPPQIEDQDYGRVQGRRTTEYPSGAPVLDKEGVETERKKMLQAEIDADNERINADEAGRARLLQEQMRQNQNQKRTRDLLKSTGQYLGRR